MNTTPTMSMHQTTAARIALAGPRPTIPMALFDPQPDTYEARREAACAAAQAWDAAVKHVVADAIRTAADEELFGLARLVCPSSHRPDGTFDRRALAAAVLDVEQCPTLGSASALARLFFEAS